MRLTAEQLETLRTRPQRTKLNLFIFNPRVVMRGRLDENISKSSLNIPYEGVGGAVKAIERDMTLLVGSDTDLSDYGRVRIRSGSYLNIQVAENDNVQWVSGSYLSVLRYWDTWPVYPRIIQNQNDPTRVTFYKDYDIPHTNQNNVLGTLINAGPHRGVLLEDNGTGTVYYTSMGTVNVANSALSYDWAFEGGYPTGSTDANPGNIAYNLAGDYVTRLRVTADNGAVDTTYRYIAVRNKIGEGSLTPVARWKMSTLAGSRDEGGYSVQITVYDDIPVMEGTVIIITADDWYGGTNVSLGGNNTGANNIFFVGYIESGSLKYSWDRSYFDFTASSITSTMKKAVSFSVSVESKQAAAKWYELQDMDVRRAIYHYLRWHSTVLKTTDVQFNGLDRKIQYFDADRGSLYDAINNLMSETLMGSFSADRQGGLYAEIKPMGYVNPTGTFVPVMDILKRDWRGEPSIEDRPYSPSSYVELGGIAYSGAFTGTFSTHLSCAPGDVPHEYGSVETDPGGLALTTQQQLNQLSGNVFYDKKFRYPSIAMENAVALRNLDIAPFETVRVDVLPEDTVLGTRINNLYLTSAMQFTYDSEKELLTSNIDLQSVVTGIPGETIIIPPVPDDEDDFDFVNIPLPVPTPIYAITDPTLLDNVLVWIYGKGFYYTTNFSDENPTWQVMMTNIDPSWGDPVNFDVTASGKVFAHFGGLILRAESFGADWEVVFDASVEVGNPEGYPFPRSQTVVALGVDRAADENVVIIASVIVTIFSTAIAYGYTWNGTQFQLATGTFIILTHHGNRHGYMIRSGNKWILSWFDASNYSTTADIADTTFAVTNVVTHVAGIGIESIVMDRSNYSENTAIVKLTTPDYTLDSGATWTPVSGATSLPYQSFGDIYHSIMDDGAGTVVYGYAGLDTYLLSTDGGGSFSSSGSVILSGIVTAINHIGQLSYVMGDNGGHLWAVHGVGVGSTGTTAFCKDGNIPYMITGTFRPILFRFYDNEDIQ